MAITYFEISYPNFVLGSIIDPEEANQNNYEIVNKTNVIIEGINSNELEIERLEEEKATIIYVDENINDLAGVGRINETIKGNYESIVSHKKSNDHDYKYYTKILIDDKLSAINSSIQLVNTHLDSHKNSNDHDKRYYTKEELTPWLKGGDTIIKEEVFIIVSSNNGDGTFTYSDNGELVVGELGESGEQIFNLVTGTYEPGNNRIEAMINDTLRRSVKSGGLIEINKIGRASCRERV